MHFENYILRITFWGRADAGVVFCWHTLTVTCSGALCQDHGLDAQPTMQTFFGFPAPLILLVLPTVYNEFSDFSPNPRTVIL